MGERESEGYHESDEPMSRSDVEGCMPTLKEVQEFILPLFEKIAGKPINLNTLCCEFFPVDKDNLSFSIGLPVSEKFGLRGFYFPWALPDHLLFYCVQPKFTRIKKCQKKPPSWTD